MKTRLLTLKLTLAKTRVIHDCTHSGKDAVLGAACAEVEEEDEEEGVVVEEDDGIADEDDDDDDDDEAPAAAAAAAASLPATAIAAVFSAYTRALCAVNTHSTVSKRT